MFHGALWQGCAVEGATVVPHILSGSPLCIPAPQPHSGTPIVPQAARLSPMSSSRAASRPAWGLVPHADDRRLEQLPGYSSRAAQGGDGPAPALAPVQLTGPFGVLFLDSLTLSY